MADRYQDRAFPAGDDYDREAGSRTSANAESDPLAELARLIGQTDPFGSRPIGRANLQVQPQARPVDRGPPYDQDHEPSYDRYVDLEADESPVPAPPSWMQRAARQEAPAPLPQQDEYPSAVHPLHRYAAEHPPAEPDYDPEPLFADTPHEPLQEPHQPDLSRYDEALYGGFDSGAHQAAQHDQGYADESYAYEEDQDFEAPEPRRRSGMITVAAVLALAVFGVGGALAYRNYTGAARNGEPPIIRPEAGPTKIMAAPADSGTKVPDRMTAADGTEKIVSREETPLDPNARSGPRVVFPPLTPNGSVPMPTTVVPGAAPPANGPTTFSNNEPHAVKTFTVRSDQATSGVPAAAVPPAAAAPAKLPPRTPGTNARASAANPNAPLSLAPQGDAPAAPAPPARVASTNPTQIAPSAPSAAASGNYLVSILSQPTEADAQAAFRTMQSKYPSVLGSQSPAIARGTTKDGKPTYRAGVSFASSAEAAQFCKSYQGAGGQCWVVKN
jgi:hypothetical protein